MVTDRSDVPLPYWLATYRLLSAPGGTDVTPRRLQEELSLPTRELADRILTQVRLAMAHDALRPSPSHVVDEPATPATPAAESWLLADTFWDHNG
jgi:hypothetical protein